MLGPVAQGARTQSIKNTHVAVSVEAPQTELTTDVTWLPQFGHRHITGVVSKRGGTIEFTITTGPCCCAINGDVVTTPAMHVAIAGNKRG
jgi:hypothetical protein